MLAREQVEADFGETIAEELHVVAETCAQIVALRGEVDGVACAGDDSWRHGVGETRWARALAQEFADLLPAAAEAARRAAERLPHRGSQHVNAIDAVAMLSGAPAAFAGDAGGVAVIH